MNLLGVRPYPLQNESFAGYCLRLAKLNGLSGLNMLFSVIAAPTSTNKSRIRCSYDDMRLIAEYLAPFLGRDTDTLSEAFGHHFTAPWIYDEHRMIQDIRLEYPRICPTCLAESGHMDWRWNLACISHCPKHETLLVDRCPECGNTFDWKVDIFTGCSKCNYTWKQHAPKSTEPSSLEKRVWECVSKNSQHCKSLLSDICAAIAVAARPLDNIHLKQGLAPKMPGYSELVETAYQLLSDEEAQMYWANTCVQARSTVATLGDRAVLAPMHNLKRLLTPNGLIKLTIKSEGFLTLKIVEYNQFVKSRRKRFLNGDLTDRLQVDVTRLSQILEAPQGCLQRIIADGLLKPCNNATVPRDLIYNLQDAAILINSIRLEEVTTNFVEIDPRSRYLSRHLGTYGELISALLRKNLSGGLRGASLRSAYVDKEQFEDWLSSAI